MPGGFHTFVTGEVLTAANMNNYVEQQVIAQVTSATRPASPVAGQTIYQTDNNLKLVYDGTAWATETPVSAFVATQQTTTSTTFTDLSTVGPSVSVQTNTSALVTLSSYMTSSATGAIASFAVSGATTIAASSNQTSGFVLQMTISSANTPQETLTSTFLITSLTAGVNTFKMQYENAAAGTALFQSRSITVTAIP